MERIFEKCEKLTEDLVNIKSVNNTEGERKVAEFIEKYLRNIPYFKEHADAVIIQPLKKDSLDRRNVFAYVKGTKAPSNDTIIFHGHLDTVGTEDFGSLEPLANKPKELIKEMLKMDISKEVREDLESGDYMTGRGACDMKSGDAVFITILEYFSERIDEFSGNLLLSLNPVEENLHTGIIEGLEVLNKLKEEKHFNYIMAINNDYICPLYKGDTKRYIYTGAAGKLLPCFYIQGKETHVGQCFEGFDASVLASELVKNINYNTDFCNGYNGEISMPPSVLKLKDLKEHYNVQTAFDAFVYFNYFLHDEDTETTMKKLKRKAEECVNNILVNMNESYKKYTKLAKVEYKEIKQNIDVLTYEELYAKAEKIAGETLVKEVNDLTEELILKKVDKREIPMYVVKMLIGKAKIVNPVVVLFFAAPYCPHNTLKKEIKEEKKVYEKLEKIIKEFAKESGEEYKIMQFFPSLSDSSYLKIDDSIESINKLINNFPEYNKLYNVPLGEIKKLNINAVNYGCYGKDAHKWTERVYKPYSFGVLPKLIIKTVEEFMN